MTVTGNPYHDPPRAEAGGHAGPADRALLAGEASIRDRKARPRPPHSEGADRELDRELAQSMDASDPPSLTQP